MQISVHKNDKCTGCKLCTFFCKKNAIDFRYSKEGFLIPFVNKNKCVKCGMCLSKCPTTEHSLEFHKQKYYFFQSDVSSEQKGASGGAFYDIAKKAISKGYVVCASSLLKENGVFLCRHIFIEREDEIEKVVGTKYIPSDLSNIYEQMTYFFRENKKVLFVGTPCQVAAIKTLAEYYKCNSLLTIDVLCFGVSSTLLFNDYLNYLEHKNHSTVIDVNFRKKINGKIGTYFYVKFANGITVIEPAHFAEENTCGFPKHFASGKLFRTNCSECMFKDANRISNITLGDVPITFYKNNKTFLMNAFDINRGISLIGLEDDFFVSFFSNKMVCVPAYFYEYYIPAFNKQKPQKHKDKRKERSNLLKGF